MPPNADNDGAVVGHWSNRSHRRPIVWNTRLLSSFLLVWARSSLETCVGNCTFYWFVPPCTSILAPSYVGRKKCARWFRVPAYTMRCHWIPASPFDVVSICCAWVRHGVLRKYSFPYTMRGAGLLLMSAVLFPPLYGSMRCHRIPTFTTGMTGQEGRCPSGGTTVLKATSGRRGWRLDGGGVSVCVCVCVCVCVHEVCVHEGDSNSEVDARCDKAVKLVIPSGSLITKCCCMYAVHATVYWNFFLGLWKHRYRLRVSVEGIK